MGFSAGMGMGLSSLLAVSTVLAILRGGCGCRHRRNDRRRADPGVHRGAALLLRATVLLRATLRPPVSRRPGVSIHTSGRGISGKLDSEALAPVRASTAA